MLPASVELGDTVDVVRIFDDAEMVKVRVDVGRIVLNTRPTTLTQRSRPGIIHVVWK